MFVRVLVRPVRSTFRRRERWKTQYRGTDPEIDALKFGCLTS